MLLEPGTVISAWTGLSSGMISMSSGSGMGLLRITDRVGRETEYAIRNRLLHSGEGDPESAAEQNAAIEHWIDLGQPDDRRLIRAAGRSRRVTVLGYHAALPIWWKAIAGKLTRLSNLDVWAIDPAHSQALAELTQRTMQLQVTVQDGLVWIADAQHSIEIVPRRLSTHQGF